MNRLIGRRIVYVLGLSVVSSCTTTKTTTVDRLRSSDEPRTLELTLTDGSRLTIRDAIATPDEITGAVSEDDAARLHTDSRSWSASPYSLVSPTETWSGYKVSIPRSEVASVKFETVDTVATMVSVLAGLAVSFLALAYSQCSRSGWC